MGVEKERGLSMTGFLFTTIVIIIFALVAFRVVPSYIEFFTVQKALDQTMQEVTQPTASEIRRSMDRRLSADYVDSVRSYASSRSATPASCSATRAVSSSFDRAFFAWFPWVATDPG